MPLGEYKRQWECVLIASCSFKLQVIVLWEKCILKLAETLVDCVIESEERSVSRECSN